jgi:fructosamine-3-kinase
MKDVFASVIQDIVSISRVSGGDINEAFLIKTFDHDLFVKYNISNNSGLMFQAESQDLQVLREKLPDHIPEVLKLTNLPSGGSCLIMEYIESEPNRSLCQEELGRMVARLHKHSNISFGLHYNNFIGRLPQCNDYQKDFIEFYVRCRIGPQFRMAVNRNLLVYSEIPSDEKLASTLSRIIPAEVPALIHGDLWSGNYLCSKKRIPFIIDPSVSYAHRELDIAMSKLFGGFENSFYRSYEEIFPLASGWQQRIEIFQLYYLLVHLNMFGLSYKASVVRILKRYLI